MVKGKHFDEQAFIKVNRSRMKIFLCASNDDLPVLKIQ